jgi:hypothetical protein
MIIIKRIFYVISLWNLLPEEYRFVEYDAILLDIGFTGCLEARGAFFFRIRTKSSATWLY